ncbi:MAG: ABC transporter ATP-binding protein [Rhizobiaceae bacterium]|nr:ABC transporter ATP-binding protein [Rhizobiaceae bacterium]
MALLNIENLTVSYNGKRNAIENATLSISPGERVGLIGESGSGKSTLALATARLLPATATQSGTINWLGGQAAPRNGLDIGYVFQDPAGSLDPVQRVGDQIAEAVSVLRGKTRSESRAIALDLIERVGFSETEQIARRYPHQLSGGQKQRIAIACALAGQPRLLIADEATSALDTIVQAGIVRLLNELVSRQGVALLFITHDLALASTLGDRLIVLRGGRIVENGTPLQIITEPKHPYVAELVASHLSTEMPPLMETYVGGDS